MVGFDFDFDFDIGGRCVPPVDPSKAKLRVNLRIDWIFGVVRCESRS